MSKIKEISQDINSILQSQINLNSIADVIREILQNGIDAKAQNISIELNVDLECESINIDYVDDGMGINPESLSNFGKRFYTSKLQTDVYDESRGLEVLKSVNTFGFRGETMHSLRNLCDTIIVISRVKDYNNGFKVCFSGDSQIGNIVKSDKVVKVGTSIKLIGLFDKVSVRKRILIENLKRSWIKDTFEIRKAALDSLIKYPFINIEIVRNFINKGNNTKKLIVRSKAKDITDKVPFQSEMKIFNIIFGGSICTEYEICKVKYRDFELKAGLGIPTTQSKNYQFIYLNGRPFKNEEILKHINNAFQKHYELWGNDIRIEEHGKVIRAKSTMFGKPYSINPIFLASITTPTEVSELIQDPSKVCFSSKNEKLFKSLFSKAIEIYFGLFSKRKTEKPESPTKIMKVKEVKLRNNSTVLKSSVRMSDMLTHELNGRLATQNSTRQYQNRAFDFGKIQKGLTKSTDINDKRSMLSINNDDLVKFSQCDDLEAPLSQSETVKKSSFFNEYSHNEITRNDVECFRIIGQVDSKFILVRFENRIIGLDQHASDERVNLEKMYDRIFNDALQQNYHKLETPILIEFGNEEEMELLDQYKISLKIWGILYEKQEELKSILVTHLTLMVAQRVAKDTDILRKGIVEYIYNIEGGDKQITKLEVLANLNKEGKLNVNQIMQTHCPAIIVETAKSRACRSAIMFGDHLSTAEQENLIRQLAHCRDPFRCAHGRPSLYPLCVLSCP